MKLHVNILGEGIPLLILHGFLGMGDNWKTHATNLAKEGFEVHVIDQRNHGRSFHADEFNYSLLVSDLKKYIEEYQLENIILLGHSMGGKVAMEFAVNYPDLVEKLIIADIAPKDYPAHHNAILKALNAVDFSVQNTRKLVDLKLGEYIPEIGIRGFLSKSLYWVEKGQLGFRFNLKSLTRNYNEIIKGLSSQTKYEGKTLFLKGENSEYISNADESLIKVHFPNSTTVEISNAGHWLHAENPKDFYNELMVFLRD